MPLEIMLNYLLGSTTLVSIYIAWSSRKSEIKKAEASALENIQSVYDKFTDQTEKRFEQMQKTIDKQTIVIKENRDEIKLLNDNLFDYQKKCKMCANK
ncbi:hypothetical protein [Flavobacterium sp.]|uniref:hypothetical protein n=1 Tax=Flavobacterium sp. TaxID=239 RepID=UPI002B4B0563|nr:hypothetical protein [Flavobacterium sp.]HLF53536.1 hypothetical protein [Flavobacterium sp.]